MLTWTSRALAGRVESGACSTRPAAGARGRGGVNSWISRRRRPRGYRRNVAGRRGLDEDGAQCLAWTSTTWSWTWSPHLSPTRQCLISLPTMRQRSWRKCWGGGGSEEGESDDDEDSAGEDVYESESDEEGGGGGAKKKATAKR